MNNPVDYLKIALITWLAVFAINRGLKAMGLTSLMATSAGASTSSSGKGGKSSQ